MCVVVVVLVVTGGGEACRMPTTCVPPLVTV
jgi:hypothetical protein